MRRVLLLLTLFIFLFSLKTLLAQDNCVSLSYMIHDAIPPNTYHFYEVYFSRPGIVDITMYPELTSTAPVQMVVLDTEQNSQIASTNPQTFLSQMLSARTTTPRRIGLAILNPSSLTARISGRLTVHLCGAPALAWALERMTSTSQTSLGAAAPIGIIDTGISFINGTYTAYAYNFTAARAEIGFTDGFAATSFSTSGTSPGASVQLNLNLEVVTLSGSLQRYWLQEVLVIESNKAYVNINIWNITMVHKDATCTLSPLLATAITGKGTVRFYSGGSGGCEGYLYAYAEPTTKPLGPTSLEVSLARTTGTITIMFLRDGVLVDQVSLTPYSGAYKASLTVKPLLWEWSPIDAELVFAGKSADYPLALLNSGQVTLKLEYLRDSQWSTPLTAWSTGGNTYEKSVASASLVRPGIVIVKPGSTEAKLLWSSIVLVKTPLGLNFSTSTDISRFIKPIIDLGNGTRLVQPTVFVEGKPFNATRVWPGAVVEIKYLIQHLVYLTLPQKRSELWVYDGTRVASLIPEVIDAGEGVRYKLEKITFSGAEVNSSYEIKRPGELIGYYRKQFLVTIKSLNETTLWVDEGTPLKAMLPEVINLGNNTRLAKPAVRYKANTWNLSEAKIIGPGTYEVTYTRQYFCTISLLAGVTAEWVDQGSTILLHASPTVINGVLYVPTTFIIDGEKTSRKEVVVDRPLNIKALYEAIADLDVSSLGFPALYAEASLSCALKSSRNSSLLVYRLRVVIPETSTADCSVSSSVMPLWPILLALTFSSIAVILFRKKKRIDK
ncbi:MAG: thermopsin family protease [Infirmifilum sp.]